FHRGMARLRAGLDESSGGAAVRPRRAAATRFSRGRGRLHGTQARPLRRRSAAPERVVRRGSPAARNRWHGPAVARARGDTDARRRRLPRAAGRARAARARQTGSLAAAAQLVIESERGDWMTQAPELEQFVGREVGKAVYGLEQEIHALTIAVIGGGNVLLEGPPGLGKTLLSNTFARVLGGTFKRIQGTADLMPSDMTGVHVFDSQRGQFVFRPGPLFADVVLVDEVNRAGPKTQSALL